MRKADDAVALNGDQAEAAASGVKGMIPIGRPFLDYVLSALADAGFTDVCIVVAPDHEMIRDHYVNRSAPKRLHISFAVQAVAIGTADAVLAAEESTRGEPFVVLNSDNYYPSDSLALLRKAGGPATIGFSRAGLLNGSNISPDRIAAYAVLDVTSDRTLAHITEKPDPALLDMRGADVMVGMNCWRFSSTIFQACRDVQPSPRGELELPLAVQYAIEVLGMRFEVIRSDAAVLDLSRRADIPRVADLLARTTVSF
jgi:glucose-1-phosphate thymidylyltransferase